jgi:signal transduction histidine kinase
VVEQPRWWFLFVLFWALFAGLTYSWLYHRLEREALEMAALRGRLVYSLIQMTRAWNAAHGGVYAPVTEKTPPNPWLEAPDKVIQTPSGKSYTLINPAYMTRQLSNLLDKETDLRVHLTSLKPINPDNAPDPWERVALEGFEKGAKESTVIQGEGKGAVFRYMAPLKVQQGCLRCHAKQGYQLGEVRGGLSVTQPVSYINGLIEAQKSSLAQVILGAFGLIVGLTFASLGFLRRQWRFLAWERDQRQAVAEELASKLRELEEARDQLVQSEKMASLGRMVAGFAHEINTPVGVAVGAASHIQEALASIRELLRQEEVSEEDLGVRLREIEQASSLTLSNLRRASQLVQSFKRTSSDQTSDGLRSYVLRELIDDCIKSLTNVFKRSEIRFEVECPPDLTLFGPAGALEQVLTNLIMNSWQHGYDEGLTGGVILIQARLDGADRVRLTYRDDGHGMDAAVAPHVFEPFYTTRRGKGGTGLGLYIAYNLVTRALGGEITCVSASGAGVIFDMTIAVRIEKPAAELRTSP